jgi:chromosome segregation ATPase
MEMTVNEALAEAMKFKSIFKAAERLEAVLKVAASLEAETARMKKEQADLTQKLADLHHRVDEKHIELQETIDSMTSTAEAQSHKAQEALGKLKRHCEEQMIKVRDKYIKDKNRMAQEIGDLEGQRAQLVKAIRKLQEQQIQLTDRAVGASA